MVKLRSFDAFPKLEGSYQTPGQPRNPAFYIFLLIALFFFYLETSTWMGAEPKFQFDVDKDVNDTMQVNLQLVVHDACDKVGIYLRDDSNDRLFVNELLAATRIYPSENPNEQWCRMSGIFQTNRVKGELIVLGPSPRANLNTSHFIEELSFGEYYPNMVNPLDHFGKTFDEPTSVEYFLTIVPATYRAFGAQVDTNLYTSRLSSTSVKGSMPDPTIVFHYDFDPIKLTISDNRMSFFAWLTRVVNIAGGVLFAIKAINGVLKPKKDHIPVGILDDPKIRKN